MLSNNGNDRPWSTMQTCNLPSLIIWTFILKLWKLALDNWGKLKTLAGLTGIAVHQCRKRRCLILEALKEPRKMFEIYPSFSCNIHAKSLYLSVDLERERERERLPPRRLSLERCRFLSFDGEDFRSRSLSRSLSGVRDRFLSSLEGDASRSFLSASSPAICCGQEEGLLHIIHSISKQPLSRYTSLTIL